MTVAEKIEKKQAEIEQERAKDGKFKRTHDPFLLWGKYPHGWQMIKDLILCLMLLNALIAQLKQIDLAGMMAEAPEIASVATIQPAEASTVTPEPKTQETAESEATDDIQSIVAKVYRLESSGGKNDSCLKEGKYNGYGYGQNEDTWYCYESHDQVKRVVTDWFERNLKQYTVQQALCRYNTGTPTDDCEYYKNYQLL